MLSTRLLFWRAARLARLALLDIVSIDLRWLAFGLQFFEVLPLGPCRCSFALHVHLRNLLSVLLLS